MDRGGVGESRGQVIARRAKTVPGVVLGLILVTALFIPLLVVAVIAFCFLWLFPRISPLMPWGDNTVDNGAQSPSSTAPIHPGGPL